MSMIQNYNNKSELPNIPLKNISSSSFTTVQNMECVNAITLHYEAFNVGFLFSLSESGGDTACW